jgi:sugar lactone lactonase YvrE
MSTPRQLLVVSLVVVSASCAKKEADQKAQTPPAPTPTPPAPAAPADAAPVAEAPKTIEVAGFQAPESVLYLADQDVYLVSNVNGDPSASDDNGFISKVTPEGQVAELKWIDGAKDDVTLSAPKGMGVRGGKLYVADIDHVRIFDLATGAPKGEIAIKGATFLNDVAASGDMVLVTDSGLGAGFKPTGSDAVYAIGADDKKVEKLVAAKDLGGPNGVTVASGQVWVSNFGNKQLYRVEGGKKVDVQELPTGALDGLVVLDDGRVLVSSWEGKGVYAGKPGGTWELVIKDIDSPADLGIDRKRGRILLPVMMGNVVRFYPIP